MVARARTTPARRVVDARQQMPLQREPASDADCDPSWAEIAGFFIMSHAYLANSSVLFRTYDNAYLAGVLT
jgi:hypothetical protein